MLNLVAMIKRRKINIGKVYSEDFKRDRSGNYQSKDI